MRIKHLLNRFLSIIVMALVMIGLSACYKDAGDDVEPTSGRVDVNDIAPTVPSTPTPLFTTTLAETTQAETTRTLVPTTTPVNFTPVAPSTDESAGSASVEMDPTPTSMFAPSFTPAVSATPTEPGISTPGMSDIQASPTLRSTTNPAFQPTPTSLPVAQNPCVHVVKPNDTLYSISQENNVTLDALIAANPSMLGGSANTTLQIGWELQLPGCQVPGSEPTAAPALPQARSRQPPPARKASQRHTSSSREKRSSRLGGSMASARTRSSPRTIWRTRICFSPAIH